MKVKQISEASNLITTLLISILVMLCYSNTFKSSWHLDDYQNIVNNEKIHASVISKNTFYNATHANPKHSKNLYRPIACLSFAINWLFTRDNIWAFHFINITIHIFSSIILFLVILKLLTSPCINLKEKDKIIFIAASTTILWACHPIQTQAVTYIVQRMASLATLFSLLSIYYFLKGRISFSIGIKSYIPILISIIFYLLAIGSKENSLILPFSIILIEFSFFRKKAAISPKKTLYLSAYIALIAILILTFYYIYAGNINLLNYSGRTFSLAQRLLTEPRIIIFYLYQLFIPTPDKFSITHDITISNSILFPISTLPSILLITVALFFSVKNLTKYRIISFSLLFFFINHAVESTIIPLELIFEHRNYLPSLFIFLPVSMFISDLVFNENKSKIFKNTITIVTCIIFITLSISTYSRNETWKNEKSLWTDAALKAPNSARPLHNLAWSYFTPKGDYPKSIELYKKALTLNDPNRHHIAVTKNNLGEVYSRTGNHPAALKEWEETITITPNYWKPYYGIVKFYTLKGDLGKANYWIKLSLKNNIQSAHLLFLKGIISLKSNTPAVALSAFKGLITHPTLGLQAKIGVGLAHYKMGNFKSAKIFFTMAHIAEPKDIKTLLYLIATEEKIFPNEIPNKYIDNLVNMYNINGINNQLKQIFIEEKHIKLPENYIYSRIENKINNKILH